ncbi:MAG: hypothetical protein HYU77_08085 [Betaproteobacteria bacterium]|nr:hypothetical protein [Betaproteobacteria bacterium]
MTDQQPQDLSNESLKQAASETVQKSVDIRASVRDLTLQAIQSRRLDPQEMKNIMRAMTEGITIGAEKRSNDTRLALSEAIKGLDEALMKAAEAGHLALKQLTTKTKDFSENELKQALANMKKLEEDFIQTLTQVTEAAGAKMKPELKELLSHAQRAGTDTGAKVAATMSEFTHRMATSYLESKYSSLEAARELSARFTLAASGFLAGLAEALRQPRKGEGKKE